MLIEALSLLILNNNISINDYKKVIKKPIKIEQQYSQILYLSSKDRIREVLKALA